MCGIAGMLSKDIDLRERRTLIKNISDSLKMRGPDGYGDFTKPYVSLIHRRLAVIDPERGAQPMTFGKYTIVYNGEIYNTEEIRNELTAAGYSFDTHCDTEIILKAYHLWKEESCKKLNGIFAYAVWDDEVKELFLCRDRIGVKPLYFTQKDGIFAFASRIKSLLLIPEVSSDVDENGLNEIFMLGPAKTIGTAVFKDIKELPPATYLKFSGGKYEIKEYWQLKAAEHTENENETIEHTHFLVTDAIRRQLISDVPLCTFLSGGLDSSIISRVASDDYRRKGKTLDTYSVDYTDNDKYFKKSLFQPNKDSDYIDRISGYLSTDHKNIILDNKDVAHALIESTYARNLPGFTDVDSSLLLFCREVKKEQTVALSGECADEIFGGYPWYHNKDILFEETFPWSRSTDVRQSILKDGLLKNGAEYAHARYLETVAKTSYLDTDNKTERRMREMFRLNLDWFMQTLLVRKDVMSMESSLEVRVPFCDYRIVEYAYNMPWSIKSLDGREKGVLRKAFENELPYEITWRKKSPYPKTHNPIYFNEVCKMVKEVLKDKTSPLYDMLNRNKIKELTEDPDALSEPWYGQLMRGPQVLAYIVQIYYWIKDNNVNFV
ncbi:MAG TPA: asparagine synthase (glutamine-hydrolyzing) [Candidatus Eubacterium faecipullorum]|uniref:asparagine synthase (glutamine-hydrolyzing) n=1 Tax=Candidatus Eubacterium faecipullorum TaxID=2838571 RepID=A0A9D1RB86_9FIRM|nr:asparagine synthase (glutamine-hydrolyzing) [Candidatus Eubacterium faecipullorum]